MTAVDAALAGDGEWPVELQMFMLATGERGIGARHVYGDRVLTVREFVLLRLLQNRVILASTPEGMKRLQTEAAVDRMIEEEEREAKSEGKGETTSTIDAIPPFDPAVMTEEQVRQWLARYG